MTTLTREEIEHMTITEIDDAVREHIANIRVILAEIDWTPGPWLTEDKKKAENK